MFYSDSVPRMIAFDSMSGNPANSFGRNQAINRRRKTVRMKGFF